MDYRYTLCKIISNGKNIGTGHFVEYKKKYFIVTNMHVFFAENNILTKKEIVVSFYSFKEDVAQQDSMSINFSLVNEQNGILGNVSSIRCSVTNDIFIINVNLKDNINIKRIVLDDINTFYDYDIDVKIYGYHNGLEIIHTTNDNKQLHFPIAINGKTLCSSTDRLNNFEDYGVLESYSLPGCSGGIVMSGEQYLGMNVKTISSSTQPNLHSNISLFIKNKYIKELLEKYFL